MGDGASTTAYVNGRFLTPAALAGEERPAATLLESGGRILALFPGDEAPPSADREIDLEGRLAIPGPVDAHCHLVSYGMMHRREADLRGCRSVSELISRLRAHARALGLQPGAGAWLLGRGFEQDLLTEGRWPSQSELDQAGPGLPVRITRVCGHAIVANRTACCLAGLDAAHQEAGFPAGVVTEGRMAAVHAAVPGPSPGEWLEAARWACREAALRGFTGVHCLMAHREEVAALVELRRRETPGVRVRMQMPFAMLESLRESGMCTGFGDDWLRIGAIKLFSDGSLGARTAALEEPYTDDPASVGELIYPPEELKRRVAEVHAAGFQVCVHAIGDRALRTTLDAIERAADSGPWRQIPRVEHASLVTPALIRRMRDLGVGAAVQPQFARSDYWAPERLGTERARGCYAFRALYEAGVPLAGSTDCPVEVLDALAAIDQLVHRPGWSPDQGLPLPDALRVFSEGGHRLAGASPGAGTLQPGEAADFLVLDGPQRPFEEENMEEKTVFLTVISGALAGPGARALVGAWGPLYNSP